MVPPLSLLVGKSAEVGRDVGIRDACALALDRFASSSRLVAPLSFALLFFSLKRISNFKRAMSSTIFILCWAAVRGAAEEESTRMRLS